MSSENNPNDGNENLNPSEKKKRGGSQKTSWVWNWFEPDETGVTCQVEVANGQLCSRHYKNASSTGNLIVHLNNKHQITEGMKKQDFVVIKITFILSYLN